MVGTCRYKIGTQICEDSFPHMTWIHGSRHPQVFSRIYLWVPAVDPDSCSALGMAQILAPFLKGSHLAMFKPVIRDDAFKFPHYN